MISLLTQAATFLDGDSECLIRIRSLAEIYGFDIAFLQFFTDGEGSFMSLMDGAAVFYAHTPVSEEWLAFLAFHTDIRRLHTDVNTAIRLQETGSWLAETGAVLRYAGGATSADRDICTTPHLPDVYHLLAEHFPHIAPFEAWYVDFSHRVRHGHCHLAAVMSEGKPVSVATTVAETGEWVILGQVATHPQFRRRGYAAKCLKALISKCKGKSLYILPVDEYAQKLYGNLGFTQCGDWAELERI